MSSWNGAAGTTPTAGPRSAGGGGDGQGSNLAHGAGCVHRPGEGAPPRDGPPDPALRRDRRHGHLQHPVDLQREQHEPAVVTVHEVGRPVDRVDDPPPPRPAHPVGERELPPQDSVSRAVPGQHVHGPLARPAGRPRDHEPSSTRTVVLHLRLDRGQVVERPQGDGRRRQRRRGRRCPRSSAPDHPGPSSGWCRHDAGSAGTVRLRDEFGKPAGHPMCWTSAPRPGNSPPSSPTSPTTDLGAHAVRLHCVRPCSPTSWG